MILAADVGGTKTELSVFDRQLRPFARQRYESRTHASLQDIVAQFVVSCPFDVSEACFGVAGPVVDGVARPTNLEWVVDGSEMAGVLGLASVGVINDLEATALGIAGLGDVDVVTLQAGAPAAAGHGAVIAAGTGLGEAVLYWDGERHLPIPSEGGHASFAPRDDVEVALLAYLRDTHEHVSWERVLSGPGLVNIFQFLRDTGRYAEPEWLADAMRSDDPAMVVSRVGLSAGAPICVAALALFASMYGSEAGNLALKAFATGGVFVAGGIAPKILPTLMAGGFAKAFRDKGRMARLLSAIPVRVVVSDVVNLRGAARHCVLANG